jgi:hypothetical protein
LLRGAREVAGLGLASAGAWALLLGVGQWARTGLAVTDLDLLSAVDLVVASAEFLCPLAATSGALLAAARWRAEGALVALEALGVRPDRLLLTAVGPVALLWGVIGASLAAEVAPLRLAAVRARAVHTLEARAGRETLRGALADGGAWVVRPAMDGPPHLELSLPWGKSGVAWVTARVVEFDPFRTSDAVVWAEGLRARVGALELVGGGPSLWRLAERHETPSSRLEADDPRTRFLWHRRLATPLAAIPLALVAVFVAARLRPGLAALVAAALVGGFHLAVRALDQAVRAGHLEPGWAAWVAPLALCTVALGLYGRAGTAFGRFRSRSST